ALAGARRTGDAEPRGAPDTVVQAVQHLVRFRALVFDDRDQARHGPLAAGVEALQQVVEGVHPSPGASVRPRKRRARQPELPANSKVAAFGLSTLAAPGGRA